jgi:hypothetical protein
VTSLTQQVYSQDDGDDGDTGTEREERLQTEVSFAQPHAVVLEEPVPGLGPAPLKRRLGLDAPRSAAIRVRRDVGHDGTPPVGWNWFRCQGSRVYNKKPAANELGRFCVLPRREGAVSVAP